MTKVSLEEINAKLLRKAGRLNPQRPTEPLTHIPLVIDSPDFHNTPKPPVDVLLILGMGPVSIAHGEISISHRMRHNTIAALELAANGFVHSKGLIIPSGTATADPDIIEKQALKMKIDVHQIYTTTEADLMQKLYIESLTKSGATGESIGIEIFLDRRATETVENFIYALNELDLRSRRKHGKIFNGSLAVITSHYHIARTMELARYLNIGHQVIPLVSQEVLRHFGYDSQDKPLYNKGDEDFDLAARWNEQKWIRTIHQKPAYLLPELIQIEDDERLILTLKHLEEVYGSASFEDFGLRDLTLKNATHLRHTLSKITRISPVVERWIKTSHKEVDKAIEEYVSFTARWLTLDKRS